MLIVIYGLVLIGITVAIHAIGSAWWLVHMKSRVNLSDGNSQLMTLFRIVLSTVTALITLHLIEVMVWALAYYLLPGEAGLISFPQAAYFSIVTFTTLGYGDITLNEQWRFLAGMEAMVGIAVFGLTTAISFAVIQKCWHLVSDRKGN